MRLYMKKKICKILVIMCFFICEIFVNEAQAQILKIKDASKKEVTTINCSIGDEIVVYQCINLTWDWVNYNCGAKWDDKFVYGVYDEVDNNGLDWYIEGKLTMTILKEGETTIEFYNNEKTSLGMLSNSATAKLKLIITDTEKEMKNAYKTVPDKNADANTISRFIKSDAAYNNLNSLKTVDVETAKKWKEQVESEMIDTISRDMYLSTVGTLEEYINGGDIEKNQTQLTEEIETAIEGTHTTVTTKLEDIIIGSDRTEGDFNDVLDDINYYRPTVSTDGQDEVIGKASTILSVITSLGMVIAVLMSAILGIKYMLGSVEEKADYKKGLIPYFVGAILLFGICTIVKAMQQFGNSINSI